MFFRVGWCLVLNLFSPFEGSKFEFSVVICTHDRDELLGRAIKSVVEQDCPRSRYEVLVVDNASTDTTPEVARAFTHPMRFCYRALTAKRPHAFNRFCWSLSRLGFAFGMVSASRWDTRVAVAEETDMLAALAHGSE